MRVITRELEKEREGEGNRERVKYVDILDLTLPYLWTLGLGNRKSFCRRYIWSQTFKSIPLIDFLAKPKNKVMFHAFSRTVDMVGGGCKFSSKGWVFNNRAFLNSGPYLRRSFTREYYSIMESPHSKFLSKTCSS